MVLLSALRADVQVEDVEDVEIDEDVEGEAHVA
jgi:hypothetical protein